MGDQRNRGLTFLEDLNELEKELEGNAPGKITVFNEDGTSFSVDYCARLLRMGKPSH